MLVCLCFVLYCRINIAKPGIRNKDDDQEESSLLASGRSAADAYAKTKTIKAALYAIQVFYSFFIM
jgi:hypothetical protein